VVTVARTPEPAQQPHTAPARSDTGQASGDAAGSRVGGADRAATRSALEADVAAPDDQPVAERADPHPDALVDPDDTSRCPVADECDGCGGAEALAVVTGETQIGVCCLTRCTECAQAASRPSGRY
jgi:hypothetical protein